MRAEPLAVNLLTEYTAAEQGERVVLVVVRCRAKGCGYTLARIFESVYEFQHVIAYEYDDTRRAIMDRREREGQRTVASSRITSRLVAAPDEFTTDGRHFVSEPWTCPKYLPLRCPDHRPTRVKRSTLREAAELVREENARAAAAGHAPPEPRTIFLGPSLKSATS